MLRALRAAPSRFLDSLFWLPTIAIVAAIATAAAALWLDARVPDTDVAWLIAFTSSTRETLLELLAGASLTVLGLATSALVIAVQLASSQYSPRLVRSFLGDGVARTGIGLLLAVFAFSAVTLAATGERPEGTPIEDVAATVALLTSLVAVVVLVAMIDRVARLMEAGTTVRRVLDEARIAIEGIAATGDGDVDALEGADGDVPGADGTPVRSPVDAWVCDVDLDAVLAATPPGGTVAVLVPIGKFAIAGYPIARTWPAIEDDDEAEAFVEGVRAAFGFGVERAVRTDAAFALRKLNDVFLRALSPAINDPGTAYEALSHLAAAIALLLRTDLAPPDRRGPHGRVLLQPFAVDHAGLVELAYEQIVFAAADDPAMAIAVLGSMRRVRTALEEEGLEHRADLMRPPARRLVALFELRDHLDDDVERVRRAAALSQREDDASEADDEDDGSGEG